jgi:hypothetical protein
MDEDPTFRAKPQPVPKTETYVSERLTFTQKLRRQWQRFWHWLTGEPL